MPPARGCHRYSLGSWATVIAALQHPPGSRAGRLEHLNGGVIKKLLPCNLAQLNPRPTPQAKSASMELSDLTADGPKTSGADERARLVTSLTSPSKPPTQSANFAFLFLTTYSPALPMTFIQNLGHSG